MNIKVFNIRLDKENCLDDQTKMNDFLDSVDVKLTSTSFVTSTTKDYWSAVVFYLPKKDKTKLLKEEELSEEEKRVYLALKEWRKEKSMQLKLPHFMICHNSELVAIAKFKPETIKDFKSIKGFGELKTQKYGDDIIALLNAL
jgi:superfamily II DNA helicase RecQ